MVIRHLYTYGVASPQLQQPLTTSHSYDEVPDCIPCTVLYILVTVFHNWQFILLNPLTFHSL